MFQPFRYCFQKWNKRNTPTRQAVPIKSMKLVSKGITTLSGFNPILYEIIEREKETTFTIAIRISPAIVEIKII